MPYGDLPKKIYIKQEDGSYKNLFDDYYSKVSSTKYINNEELTKLIHPVFKRFKNKDGSELENNQILLLANPTIDDKTGYISKIINEELSLLTDKLFLNGSKYDVMHPQNVAALNNLSGDSSSTNTYNDGGQKYSMTFNNKYYGVKTTSSSNTVYMPWNGLAMICGAGGGGGSRDDNSGLFNWYTAGGGGGGGGAIVFYYIIKSQDAFVEFELGSGGDGGYKGKANGSAGSNTQITFYKKDSAGNTAPRVQLVAYGGGGAEGGKNEANNGGYGGGYWVGKFSHIDKESGKEMWTTIDEGNAQATTEWQGKPAYIATTFSTSEIDTDVVYIKLLAAAVGASGGKGDDNSGDPVGGKGGDFPGFITTEIPKCDIEESKITIDLGKRAFIKYSGGSSHENSNSKSGGGAASIYCDGYSNPTNATKYFGSVSESGNRLIRYNKPGCGGCGCGTDQDPQSVINNYSNNTYLEVNDVLRGGDGIIWFKYGKLT